MTSERRIKANRDNACKSTGPKSVDGKSRSSQNALRHGLEAIHIHDALTHEKIKRLAAMICDDDAEPIEQELATTIAECQVTLSRVRAARIRVVERIRTTGVPSYVPGYLSELELQEVIPAMMVGKLTKATRFIRRLTLRVEVILQQAMADTDAKKRSLEENPPPDIAANYHQGKRRPRNDAESFRFALPELLVMDRYEARALSRRRRAMDAFRYIRAARVDRSGIHRESVC